MHRVYFDRNVFSALSEFEGGLTPADVDKIKGAVAAGSIKILASSPLLEETAATMRQSREMYRRHMGLVLELIDRRRLIKPGLDIVSDDCFNYAMGLPEGDRTIPATDRVIRLFELWESEPLVEEVTDAGQRRRTEDTAALNAIMVKTRSDNRWVGAVPRPTLEQLWEELGAHLVAYWVNKCQPEIKQRCHERGLEEMLDLKGIRFQLLHFTSMSYISLFGVSGKHRKVKHGDLPDAHHATCASAVDVFVTNESKTRLGKLGHTLSWKPTSGFEVLNLGEFLNRIYVSGI